MRTWFLGSVALVVLFGSKPLDASEGPLTCLLPPGLTPPPALVEALPAALLGPDLKRLEAANQENFVEDPLAGPFTFATGTGSVPLWRGRGSFGDELYGFEMGTAEEGILDFGAAPVLRGLATLGYAAGFRYVRGDWELRGDYRTDLNAYGRPAYIQGLRASLELSSNVSFRLEYLTRSVDDARGSGREDRIGGGLEFGF